jgi:glycosyltransferase involved in cell wall biosynthesis
MVEDKERGISVVVPLFNEEDSLRALYREITLAMESRGDRSYEIVFVDDGSTDRSFDVCSDLYGKDPEHVRVIRLRRNFGQTAAMAAGFDAARGRIIIPMDADLQNDPADILRLVAKMEEGYDVVSGWRADRKDPFLSRRLPSAAANALISWITGVRLHDYGCTLKAYHRSVAEHIALYGEMHRFLPALASWAGARVTEIKVNHRPRRFGNSKYGLGRTLRVFLDLITIKFLLSYSTQPMQVFGKWGLVAFFIGFLSGILTAVLKFFPPHKDVTGNPWMYICIFFCLGGLQLIGMGLLGEINVRTYYESQKKPIYTIRETRGLERKT